MIVRNLNDTDIDAPEYPIVWKVTTLDDMSWVETAHNLKCHYKLGEWTTSPLYQWGFGIFAFSTYERARYFAYLNTNYRIYEAEANGIMKDTGQLLPTWFLRMLGIKPMDNWGYMFRSLNPMGFMDDNPMPIGTVMCQQIRPIRLVMEVK